MFRLTRQVRFAINSGSDDQLTSAPTNSFGGYPSLCGLGYFFALDVTVSGALEQATSYLINIKQIDNVVRRDIVPMLRDSIAAGQFTSGGIVVHEIFHALRPPLLPVVLEGVTLNFTPTFSLACFVQEDPMIRLSQKFEFSASHRLHNASFTEQQNREAFGKCNNPHGHGHNYEVQVTIIGEPDPNGTVIDVPTMEKIVDERIIKPFDHKNLNVEIADFRDGAGLNPTVENIAMVIYRTLKPAFQKTVARLHSIKLWETPKTWCEYSE